MDFPNQNPTLLTSTSHHRGQIKVAKCLRRGEDRWLSSPKELYLSCKTTSSTAAWGRVWSRDSCVLQIRQLSTRISCINCFLYTWCGNVLLQRYMHVESLSANTFSIFGKNRQPGSKPVFLLLIYRCLEMVKKRKRKRYFNWKVGRK